MNTVPSHPSLVADFLSTLHLGPRQAAKQLTLWPLLREESAPGSTPFVLLAEALEAGWLEVGEVSEEGLVPHVRVTNRGKQAVLVLFGEELVGAKQNRVSNASFLVPAEEELVIDVSCVEQGRWHRGGGAVFASSDHVASSFLRRKMASNVAESRGRGAGFDADQGEVWDEVRDRLAGSGTRSRSEAYSDYRESRSTDLAEIQAAFRPVAGQVGFVAALGETVEGIEVLAEPRAFEAAFPRLLSSYAIDAVDQGWLRAREGEEPDAEAFDAPEAFLEALAEAPVREGPSLGAGLDLRIEGERVAGCALAQEGIVHLPAFPQQRRRPGGRRRRIYSDFVDGVDFVSPFEEESDQQDSPEPGEERRKRA
jgi:hypothetical protein